MARNFTNTAVSVHQRLLNKAKLPKAPDSFADVAMAVKVFLGPIVASLVDKKTFQRFWTAPGPWL